MEKKYLHEEYKQRINKVIDFIEANIDKEINMDELADIANFSRFHFHRIFRFMMGETIGQFIQRIRIERSALTLIGNRKASITEIAIENGFSGSAVFARNFKSHFGISASNWRQNYNHSNMDQILSKIRKTRSNEDQTLDIESTYFDNVISNNLRNQNMFDKSKVQIEVKNLDPVNVAYVRNVGPYVGDAELFEKLFTKLFNWAGSRDLIKEGETQCYSVYHDDPEITPPEKQRISVALNVPDNTNVDGEIGQMKIEGGKHIVAKAELRNPAEYMHLWKYVYGEYLPQSGYIPENKPPFECYHNNPKEHPEGIHIVSICLPVKPL